MPTKKILIYATLSFLRTCLEDIEVGVSKKSMQAGQTNNLVAPGLGVLCPRGGWSISHKEITYKKIVLMKVEVISHFVRGLRNRYNIISVVSWNF